MTLIHKNYNLSFINNIFKGHSSKTCDLINKYAIPNYINLSTYLIYLQFADDIIESIIPEVENSLNDKSAEDISVETVTISFDGVNSNIEWNGKTEVLPTVDFKIILQEYADFLQADPMNGTKI